MNGREGDFVPAGVAGPREDVIEKLDVALWPEALHGTARVARKLRLHDSVIEILVSTLTISRIRY